MTACLQLLSLCWCQCTVRFATFALCVLQIQCKFICSLRSLSAQFFFCNRYCQYRYGASEQMSVRRVLPSPRYVAPLISPIARRGGVPVSLLLIDALMDWPACCRLSVGSTNWRARISLVVLLRSSCFLINWITLQLLHIAISTISDMWTWSIH